MPKKPKLKTGLYHQDHDPKITNLFKQLKPQPQLVGTAFSHRKIGQEELRITQSEWILLENLVKFLRSFREAVEILSSQKTCTMNVALVFRSEIMDVLKLNQDDDALIMLSLKSNMMKKMSKRFPVTKPIVAAALLDNRFMSMTEIEFF
ncbi:unnamed protein product [Parnassius mnemosyne]|uniref:Uncharacterized protein n=1 Tax=Parnassius mnemosyne TaxID=213953 RepID=A0AAV1L8A8_9NEOP